MSGFYLGLELNTWIGIVLILAIIFSIPTVIYIYHRSETKLKLIVYYILFILMSGMIAYVMLGGRVISIV